MRLAKLYLKAFGPYTERVIELDASGASLHLLYGPNEAGKSSLLRDSRALLRDPRAHARQFPAWKHDAPSRWSHYR